MSELLRIQGRVSEIADGLQVRRVLPSAPKRSVGPFVFFDHIGPVIGTRIGGKVILLFV